MERLPDFIRARLRQIAHSKPPPKTLLVILRELAQEYKAFLSDDAARGVVDGKPRLEEAPGFALGAEAYRQKNAWARLRRRFLEHVNRHHVEHARSQSAEANKRAEMRL